MTKQINPAQIKALAIDLDGTSLLPDNTMGERTKRCLKRLIKNGIPVIICTGRAVESSRRYYEAIGAEGPMVFFNGAVVADIPPPGSCQKVKILESRHLSLDVVNYGVDLAREDNLHFQAFLPPDEKQEGHREILLIEKLRPEAKFYLKHTSITPVITDLKEAIAVPEVKSCIKAMFITDPGLHDGLRKKMLNRFGDTIYITRTYPTFLEIMASGVSKGEGLKTVMRYRDIKPEEVIAFGDEENDLPMFPAAGFSAAPSNAKETVKQAADFIYGSNAEEGLAVFLENIFR